MNNALIAAVAFLAATALSFGAESTAATTNNQSGAKSERKAENQAFRASQQEKRKAQQEQQQAENKTFREGEKGKEPTQVAADVKAHRGQQFAENQQFRQEQFDRLYSFVSQKLTEKNVSDSTKSEILQALTTRFNEIKTHRQTQHNENMQVLTELAQKTGLTREELHNALKAQHQTQKAENEKFREAAKENMKEVRQKLREEVKAEGKAGKKSAARTTDSTAATSDSKK